MAGRGGGHGTAGTVSSLWQLRQGLFQPSWQVTQECFLTISKKLSEVGKWSLPPFFLPVSTFGDRMASTLSVGLLHNASRHQSADSLRAWLGSPSTGLCPRTELRTRTVTGLHTQVALAAPSECGSQLTNLPFPGGSLPAAFVAEVTLP